MRFYDDDERVFHIRLNAKQRAILLHMKEKYGASSRTQAIRACIEHMGEKLGSLILDGEM